MQPATGSPLTLADLARILLRYRWQACACLVAVSALVMWLASRTVPLYEASAALRLDRVARQGVFERERDSEGEINLVNAKRDLLLSTPTLELALADPAFAGLPRYAGAERVGLLKQRLRVVINRESMALQLALRDEQRERVALQLQAVLAAFVQRQDEQHAERTTKAMAFLEKQVEEARVRLVAAREREREYRVGKAIISADPDDNFVAIRLRELNTHRASLDQRLSASDALNQQLSAADAVADPGERLRALLGNEVIGRNAAVESARVTLNGLRERERALAQRYLDKHPRLIEIRAQIAAKQDELALAVTAARAVHLSEREKLLIESRSIDEQMAKEEKALSDLRNNLFALATLNQETRSQEEIFQQLLARLNQEKVSSQLQADSMTVIEPAQATPFPVNISTKLTAAVALALGLVAASATAFILHLLDGRIRGVLDARSLTGMPLLGRIPYIESLAPLANTGNHEQHPDLAEAYRGLRTAVKLALRSDGCQCVAVTSTDAHEGKSTVSVHLAASLAATGVRVLLVDADMRKPDLHRMLGQACERGLSSLLAGDGAGAGPVSTRYRSLDLLGVGIRPGNPAELLHGRHLAGLIAGWRDDYSFIVIDTPPLGPVSDAMVVGEHADGILVVVRDRVTAKAGLAQVVDHLSQLSQRMMGLVFNCERGERQKYGYPYLYSTAGKQPQPTSPPAQA